MNVVRRPFVISQRLKFPLRLCTKTRAESASAALKILYLSRSKLCVQRGFYIGVCVLNYQVYVK